MAVLPIAYLGHPVLRRVADPVGLEQLTAPGDNELQKFIDDMIETMHDEGGVGIAAPQVQRSLQIIVVEYQGNERYPDGAEIPLEVYVNPVITWVSEEKKEFWEGCLSVKDLRGLVRRPSACTMEAYTRRGERVVVKADGFLAVVLQHEIDHLNGKVFLDRMEDLTQLSYEKEFMTYWVKSAEENTEPQQTV
ncbi:peptide deformylase [Nitrospina gracilis]|uniref:peptide deformylase n=1 Tax=Nitrospina sp. Nb-3 TaxID=2940485 RepID=UPI001EFFC1D1|nr:peptide deformylase [Nitrospina sp. Nb-3]